VYFFDTHKNPDLLWLIILGVISLPIQALSLVLKAEHAIDGRYHYQSFVNACTNIFNIVVYTLCLYFGLGVISFAVGLLLSSILNYALFKYHTPKINTLKSLKIRRSVGWFLLQKLWLIALGNGLNTMALRVDYLVLGLVASAYILGHYYMGFMMAGTITILFTTGLQGIIMPNLVKKSSNTTQLKISIDKMLFVSLFAGGILALGFLFVLPDMVFIAWDTKWDIAVFVALGLSITLPITISRVNIMVLLDAKGLWKERALVHCVNFVTIGVVTLIGWYYGQLLGVVLAMILQRILFSIIIIGYIHKAILNISYLQALLKLLQYSTPFIIVTLLAIYFNDIIFQSFSNNRGFMPLWGKTPMIIVWFFIYCLLSYGVLPQYITQKNTIKKSESTL
jgi:O-antigen/teichoic acid export membrane protein